NWKRPRHTVCCPLQNQMGLPGWNGLVCGWAWVGEPEPCLLLGPSPGPGAAGAGFPRGLMMYFRWLTFRLDLTGLSRASLILLEAESMKLSRSLVVSLKSPPSSLPISPSRLPSRLLSMSYSIRTAPGKQKLMNGEFITARDLSELPRSLPSSPTLQINCSWVQ
uniref:Uncharacterized protein n=1 Tax=Esox lucius TaxID=8010 RepID=A0AAY5KBI0_ESOLU